jgi:hypothetical protein
VSGLPVPVSRYGDDGTGSGNPGGGVVSRCFAAQKILKPPSSPLSQYSGEKPDCRSRGRRRMIGTTGTGRPPRAAPDRQGAGQMKLPPAAHSWAALYRRCYSSCIRQRRTNFGRSTSGRGVWPFRACAGPTPRPRQCSPTCTDDSHACGADMQRGTWWPGGRSPRGCSGRTHDAVATVPQPDTGRCWKIPKAVPSSPTTPLSRYDSWSIVTIPITAAPGQVPLDGDPDDGHRVAGLLGVEANLAGLVGGSANVADR